MGTTSEKLTYLNTTKEKIKDSINNLGGSIDSNTTFRDYATQLDSIYSRLPKVTGTGSDITLTPTLKGRLGSVLKGDTKQSILPSGYTQVDYIQSSGTQYIDTGYVINDKCLAKYKYEYISGAALSGVYNGVNNPNNDLYFGIVRSSTGKLTYRYAGDFYEGNIPSTNTLYDVEVSLVKNNQYLKVNGNIEVQSTNNTSITNTKNCYIFSINGLDINKISAKIYYFKIYDNNVLVRDFIPCYRNSDNEVGMYDLVNNVFYTNQGTGTFTYGSVAPTPDAEIPIQCVEGIQNVSIVGKNLLPFTNQDFTLKNVRYYVQNGNLYLDGTSTGETSGNATEFKDNFSFTLPAGSYVFNRGQNADSLSLPTYIRKYSDNTTLATNWGRFTLQEQTKVFLGFYVYGKTFNNANINCQLEKGDNVTTYEEHKEQTYEVNLEGKNKLNLSILGKVPSVSTGELVNSGTGATTDFILINNTQNYIISYVLNGSGSAYVFFYDEDYNFIGQNLSASGYNLSNSSYFSNAKYIRIRIDSYTNFSELQLELGSTSTSYVPYREPIKLYNGDYITGTPDNWSIIRNWKEVIFNGSESTWGSWNVGTVNRYYVRLSDDNVIIDNGYCDYFILGDFADRSAIDNDLKFFVGIDNNLGLINFRYDSITTLANFKTWLSTHNTEVVYKLATPTTTPITDTYLISQLNNVYNLKSYDDTTNISTSGNLPMIIEASALKGSE